MSAPRREAPPLVLCAPDLPDGRWSTGTVDDVEVFTDQLCQACGHAPCPCCNGWCDVLGPTRDRVLPDGCLVEVCVDEDLDDKDVHPERWDRDGLEFGLCCDGQCAYLAEPRFTLRDGSPWGG